MQKLLDFSVMQYQENIHNCKCPATVRIRRKSNMDPRNLSVVSEIRTTQNKYALFSNDVKIQQSGLRKCYCTYSSSVASTSSIVVMITPVKRSASFQQ